MFLKLAVLAMSILQVVGAGYLSIGTFEQSERALPVLVQPAGWAFSIWGLIYTLSFIYAVYQVIPKYDNDTLAATRVPALIAFVGSTAWLYFAGMQGSLVWLTIPVLFGIAYALTSVVNAPEQSDRTKNVLSKKVLYPYAAWTAIAAWINIPTLLIERGIVSSSAINFWLNIVLFVAIATTTLFYFKQTERSVWYGGVMVWAATGVIAANVSDGSTVFIALAAALILVTIGLYVKRISS